MINITITDNGTKQFEPGVTVYEAAKSISDDLARSALGGLVDGEVKELTCSIDSDCELKVLTFEDKEGKDILRHTASHVMAQAVKRLYPDTKLAIGPAIDDGFYYDFDSPENFTMEDLKKIEAEMKKIVKERLKLEKFELPRKEAIELLQKNGRAVQDRTGKRLTRGRCYFLLQAGRFHRPLRRTSRIRYGMRQSFQVVERYGCILARK